jgi:uncharacterized membrane protein YbhN (UPF0104 family)
LSKILRPRFVLPLILSVALLAALLTFGNVRQVIALLSTFQLVYLLYILLLLVAYEAVQGLQWHVLLRALGIRVPLRAQAFAFLVGEPTRVLPIGNFVENYLLLRAEGTDFGLSSAATLFSVLIEVAVSLAGLVILGLGPWGWLRPLIIIGLAVFLPAAWALHRVHYAGSAPAWVSRSRRLSAALDEVKQFRMGAVALLHPRVLACAGSLGALYLVLGGTTLYCVLRGLGVTAVSWNQVLAVYFFSLAFALIVPLPVDIGVTELGGVAALLVIGVAKAPAVSALLLMRALSLGTAVAIALVTIAVMRDELRALLRERAKPAAMQSAARRMPAARMFGRGGCR